MTKDDKIIYEAILNNSIIFLKRGIKEILSHNDLNDEPLQIETAVFSIMFIQTSIELALKAYYVRKCGIRSIIQSKYDNYTEQQIYKAFEGGTLRTKRYNDLKKELETNKLIWFGKKEYDNLLQFQQFRNKLIHLNLDLSDSELFYLEYELIYSIVHILLSFLTDIDYECETTGEFYEKYLDKDDYHALISYPLYINEMEKIAKIHGEFIYNCPNCSNRTFATKNSICYCCNLNYNNGATYVDCISCKAVGSVAFDELNIDINNNIINGLCLNCECTPDIFKCPVCANKYSFFSLEELMECKPNKCSYT